MNIRLYIIFIGCLLIALSILLIGIVHSHNPLLSSLGFLLGATKGLYAILSLVIEKKKLYIAINFFVPIIVILYFIIDRQTFRRYFGILKLILGIIIFTVGVTYYVFEAFLSPVIPPASRSRDFAAYYLGALGIHETRNFYYDWAYYIRDKRQDHPYITVEGPDPDPGYLDRQIAIRGIGRIPPYTYPPIWYIMCLPLLAFQWETAFDAFMICNQFFLCIALLFLPINYRYRPPVSTIMLLTGLLLYFYPLTRTINGGQANMMVLMFVVLSLYFLKHDKQKISGLFLALATAIKLHPVLLIGYCALRKYYGLVFSAIVCLILIMVISAWVVGLKNMGDYYLQVLPKWASNLRAHDMNISFAGFVSRILIGYKWLKAPFHHPQVARFIITSFSILTLAGLVLVFSQQETLINNTLLDLEFSIVIITTSLISTWTLDHHLVLLIIPFAVIMQVFNKSNNSASKYVLLIIAYILISWRFHYWEPFYRQGWGTLLLSIRTLGLGLLMATVFLAYYIEVKRVGANE